MKFLLLLIAVLSLSGCGLSRSDTETGTVAGQLNGAPVELKWQRDSEGDIRIQLPPVAQMAASVLPPPWGTVATLLASGLTAASGAFALSAKKRADEHKADAAEGWKLALDGAKPLT